MSKRRPSCVTTEPEGGKLRGVNVLVTEDDLFVAMDLSDTLKAAGAKVVGPVGSTARAIRLLEYNDVHTAVLDVNLDREFVFPLAEVLAEKEIPFLFATGCDPSIIPQQFSRIPVCEKPVEPTEIVSVLSHLFANSP